MKVIPSKCEYPKVCMYRPTVCHRLYIIQSQFVWTTCARRSHLRIEHPMAVFMMRNTQYNKVNNTTRYRMGYKISVVSVSHHVNCHWMLNQHKGCFF